jgi:hypothetical protein
MKASSVGRGSNSRTTNEKHQKTVSVVSADKDRTQSTTMATVYLQSPRSKKQDKKKKTTTKKRSLSKNGGKSITNKENNEYKPLTMNDLIAVPKSSKSTHRASARKAEKSLDKELKGQQQLL